MAVVTNCYVSLEDIKTRLGGVSIDGGDSALEEAIVSACRMIDTHCRQKFTSSSSATARTFQPLNGYTAFIDPFHEAPTVVATDSADDGTFATTWTSSDYELGYFGDQGQAVSAPYYVLRAVGTYLFPTTIRRRFTLRVTAKWGWAAPPQDVVEAARILSSHLWHLKNAPHGIMSGTVDFGGVRIGKDHLAQVTSLLRDFVIEPIGVA